MSDATPGVEDDPVPQRQVEVLVAEEVYEAAMARGIQQGHALAAVARAVMYAQASRAADETTQSEDRPPPREYGRKRLRVRFSTPAPAYEAARDTLHRSGRSVSRAVEDGLIIYIQTGLL